MLILFGFKEHSLNMNMHLNWCFLESLRHIASCLCVVHKPGHTTMTEKRAIHTTRLITNYLKS